MPHTKRPALHRAHPVHVTIRLLPGLPSLRRRRMYNMIRNAFLLGGDRFGFRLCHYSVQSNHLHLIAEAKGKEALGRGMQGLSIRLAKGINREAGRKGRVFTDRYFVTTLTSPRQVRSGLRYVLSNLRKHARERGETLSPRFVDSYSSGAVFDGWREWWVKKNARGEPEPPVHKAKTWLLAEGWRKAGLIAVKEVPGARA